MKFGKSFWIKLGIESLLIIFSVLLALFLNEYRASNKEEEKTVLVMHSIRKELEANHQIIETWHKNHTAILQNIQEYRNRPQDYDGLIKGNQLQIQYLFNEEFIPNVVRSTAWETAKTTGLVQNFDLSLTNKLSDVYDLQRLGAMSTLQKLTNLITERETHLREHVPSTLVLLEFSMHELVGQENLLLTSYKDALKELDVNLNK